MFPWTVILFPHDKHQRREWICSAAVIWPQHGNFQSHVQTDKEQLFFTFLKNLQVRLISNLNYFVETYESWI